MSGASAGSWDAGLYDSRLGFVSRFGRGVVELLDPRPGEKILDLGCGTGDLTQEISAAGAVTLGLDSSPEMISRASQKYPDLGFALGDAATFRLGEQFDAVFSNAVLHWVPRAHETARSIRLALRPGGRFVAEFGGSGNVATILTAIEEALEGLGVHVSERNPWYYPSVGEYASLLESCDFCVRYAAHFDRPTRLEGEDGLARWLDAFGGSFFAGLSETERSAAYTRISEKLGERMYRDGTWIVDYKRIRVLATRE